MRERNRPLADATTPTARSAVSPAARAPGAPSSASRARAASARLLLDFEHPLRACQLRLWLDEELVLDETLAGLKEELEVAPGRHDVRVTVSWEGNEKSERIWGTFKPGETRRLEVRLGRLRKNLSVDWK